MTFQAMLSTRTARCGLIIVSALWLAMMMAPWARAGETANQAGTGALGAAGPDQVGGVEHSEVPEEYREQVGRYFQP